MVAWAQLGVYQSRDGREGYSATPRPTKEGSGIPKKKEEEEEEEERKERGRRVAGA